jgi:hypothetical protein
MDHATLLGKSLNKAKQEIPAILSELGGKNELPRKRISARYLLSMTEEYIPGGIDIAGEIMAAIAAEAQAETVFALFSEARGAVVPVELKCMDYVFDSSAEFATKLKELSVGFDSPIYIVSPTDWTIMQCAGDVVSFPVSETYRALSQFGTLDDRPVFVDQYCNDVEPSLVVDAGWFNYVYDNVLTATADDVSCLPDEKQIHFDNDVTVMLNKSKIRALKKV